LAACCGAESPDGECDEHRRDVAHQSAANFTTLVEYPVSVMAAAMAA
jgi:hypothetical protein